MTTPVLSWADAGDTTPWSTGPLVVASQRFAVSYSDWRGVFGTYETTMAAPHIWVPKLTLPQMAVAGAAAAIITNPEITRRFWAGWRL